MPYKPGFEEDGFLRTLAPFEPREIELKAENCTKVSVVNQINNKRLLFLHCHCKKPADINTVY